MYRTVYNTNFNIVCTPTAALIKTHFEGLRAFLLFLLPLAVMKQLCNIFLANILKHFRNKYACKLQQRITIMVQCSAVLKKDLNSAFWINSL